MNRFWQQRQFKRYLEDNWQRLYRLAYAWSHHPQTANDLLQETLSKTLKQRHQFENNKALDVWLYKVMANCWRDHCRRHRETIDFEEAGLISNINLETEQYQRELKANIQHAMARLNMTHRQIVTLVDLQELSYNEVADILDIPAGTVMSRLCRARQQLREYLQQAGIHAQHKSSIRRIK
jgi:RNA polymerase sigma-70 factor (ECF subfamily)